MHKIKGIYSSNDLSLLGLIAENHKVSSKDARKLIADIEHKSARVVGRLLVGLPPGGKITSKAVQYALSLARWAATANERGKHV